MSRAKAGDEVTMVISMEAENAERYAIFSSVAEARKWMDRRPNACVCVETMVVDVPEFGNEAEKPNG